MGYKFLTVDDGNGLSLLKCLEPWLERVSLVSLNRWSLASPRCLHLHVVVVMLLSAGPQLVVLTTVIVQGLSLRLGLPHNMATSK